MPGVFCALLSCRWTFTCIQVGLFKHGPGLFTLYPSCISVVKPFWLTNYSKISLMNWMQKMHIHYILQLHYLQVHSLLFHFQTLPPCPIYCRLYSKKSQCQSLVILIPKLPFFAFPPFPVSSTHFTLCPFSFFLFMKPVLLPPTSGPFLHSPGHISTVFPISYPARLLVLWHIVPGCAWFPGSYAYLPHSV